MELRTLCCRPGVFNDTEGLKHFVCSCYVVRDSLYKRRYLQESYVAVRYSHCVVSVVTLVYLRKTCVL